MLICMSLYDKVDIIVAFRPQILEYRKCVVHASIQDSGSNFLWKVCAGFLNSETDLENCLIWLLFSVHNKYLIGRYDVYMDLYMGESSKFPKF